MKELSSLEFSQTMTEEENEQFRIFAFQCSVDRSLQEGSCSVEHEETIAKLAEQLTIPTDLSDQAKSRFQEKRLAQEAEAEAAAGLARKNQFRDFAVSLAFKGYLTDEDLEQVKLDPKPD